MLLLYITYKELEQLNHSDEMIRLFFIYNKIFGLTFEKIEKEQNKVNKREGEKIQ